MAALHSNVQVGVCGQSQAVMFEGSGETAEPQLPTSALARLSSLLSTYMPGVTVSCTRGPTLAGTPMLRLAGEAGTNWWNVETGGFGSMGIDTRDHFLARGGTGRLGVMVHYCQTQDASRSPFDASVFRNGLRAYYAALHAAVSPSFAQFVILPVVNAARPTGSNNLGAMRAAWEALSGRSEISGFPPLNFVLPPVSPTGWLEIGAYMNGSGDFTHIMRSTSHRAALGIAVRIAGLNGFVPPVVDQPRLARAVMAGPNTLRVYIVSPGRAAIKAQGNPGFSLTAGSIGAIGPVVNTAVAATGYATIDLTVNGVGPLSRLRLMDGNTGGSSFANGTTSPRGTMLRCMFADTTPGASLTITDACEDVLAATPVLHVAQSEHGVPVEFP